MAFNLARAGRIGGIDSELAGDNAGGGVNNTPASSIAGEQDQYLVIELPTGNGRTSNTSIAEAVNTVAQTPLTTANLTLRTGPEYHCGLAASDNSGCSAFDALSDSGQQAIMMQVLAMTCEQRRAIMRASGRSLSEHTFEVVRGPSSWFNAGSVRGDRFVREESVNGTRNAQAPNLAAAVVTTADNLRPFVRSLVAFLRSISF